MGPSSPRMADFKSILMSPTHIHQTMFPSHHWMRSKPFYSLVTIAVILFLFTIASITDYTVPSVSSLASHARDFRIPIAQFTLPREKDAEPEAVHLKGIDSRYAFATFLVGSDEEKDYEDDHYFIATRTLAYQLLHAEETRSRDRSIPFLVVVTDKVTERQRERLRADGATVVSVPALSADWLNPGISAWDHVMTKLRLWEFVDFERIAFIDADTILAGPLDDIFDDPAVAEQLSGFNEDLMTKGAAPIPQTYVFAGNAESKHEHHFPPKDEDGDFANIEYLNAGFFVFKPDVELLKHYVSVLRIPDSFNSNLPEQNLLNHVHRRDGNMPWLQLNVTLNIHYPTIEDVRAGARTIHEKFWHPDPGPLRLWMEAWRWRMEGYFEAMDRIRQP